MCPHSLKGSGHGGLWGVSCSDLGLGRTLRPTPWWSSTSSRRWKRFEVVRLQQLPVGPVGQDCVDLLIIVCIYQAPPSVPIESRMQPLWDGTYGNAIWTLVLVAQVEPSTNRTLLLPRRSMKQVKRKYSAGRSFLYRHYVFGRLAPYWANYMREKVSKANTWLWLEESNMRKWHEVEGQG